MARSIPQLLESLGAHTELTLLAGVCPQNQQPPPQAPGTFMVSVLPLTFQSNVVTVPEISPLWIWLLESQWAPMATRIDIRIALGNRSLDAMLTSEIGLPTHLD
ncbi:hypothetical protein VULLAG_LOCUS23028 [Vulpes lagopus]